MRAAQGNESQRQGKQCAHAPHDSRPGPRRRQGALSLASDAVDCKEQPTSPRLSGRLVAAGEADTWRCYKLIA